jgi:hypothetical protein
MSRTLRLFVLPVLFLALSMSLMTVRPERSRTLESINGYGFHGAPMKVGPMCEPYRRGHVWQSSSLRPVYFWTMHDYDAQLKKKSTATPTMEEK